MTLPVGDLDRSLAFYRAAPVEGMGWTETVDEGLQAFGPEGREDLSLAEGGPLASPIHLAFAAESREQVEGFHREGLTTGGTDNGAPGIRVRYSPRYFAAFPLDPDGHDVEAVWPIPA
jgi:catechol 2,3-dioxygenase-like lactoylglutathione lyase family enzyme